MIDYPRALARARRILGHTQHDAAEWIGVAEATFNRWERGARIPTAGLQRRAVARYLKAAERLSLKMEGADDGKQRAGDGQAG